MNETARETLAEKLEGELRRGALVLAVLSQMRTARYGYALLQRLADRGLGIEQGTLYPLLRRLDEQGLLLSDWSVEGSRPRKYYRLSVRGEAVLDELRQQWRTLVGTMDTLLQDSE